MTNLNLFFSELIQSIEKYYKRTFFFFSELQKIMSSTEPYGDFRVDFLHDDNGEKLWDDNLFLNIYDFWCIRRDGFLLKIIKRKILY